MNEETYYVELCFESETLVASLIEADEEQLDIELAEFELKHPLTERLQKRDTGRTDVVQLFFNSSAKMLLSHKGVPLATRAVLLKEKGCAKKRQGLTIKEVELFLKKVKLNGQNVKYIWRKN